MSKEELKRAARLVAEFLDREIDDAEAEATEALEVIKALKGYAA